MGSPTWRLQSHYNKSFYFLPLSTPEGWKAELTVEPPSCFEHWTPKFGIQHLKALSKNGIYATLENLKKLYGSFL